MSAKHAGDARSGGTVCIKIGGSTIDTPGLLAEFGRSIEVLAARGHAPVVVHGGGKDIGRQLAKLNKQYMFVEGMRVTDAETMQAVQMVLSGDVNKRIVNALLGEGVSAVGVCGIDAGLFEAEKLVINGADIGCVGTIARVDTRIVDLCGANGMVPVVSPVSRDRAGEIYNVNADLAASELAKALGAGHLIFVSDVDGVLIDSSVAREIRVGDVEFLAGQRHITGGMLPKLRAAADAVNNGVGRVHICGWRGVRTFVEELSDSWQGTVVY
ncbi:MAG: acetylglutamate kinase [Chitinivibrionales bacterium]|nr:acetylglutamate kinase [Chitinivibrionales bacterium]MBD3395826.1 acetylglutamate kinase [Chitinivibrionales bacterium]